MMSSPGSSFETSLISHMFYLLCVFLGKKSFLLFFIVFKGKCPTPPHQCKTVQWYWINRHSSLDSFNVYFYFMVVNNLQCYSSMQSRICSAFRCHFNWSSCMLRLSENVTRLFDHVHSGHAYTRDYGPVIHQKYSLIHLSHLTKHSGTVPMLL